MDRLLIVLIICICIGCKDKIEHKKIISLYNNETIGDSIIVNGTLRKIIFNGYSTDDVDSIVFTTNKHLILVEQKSYHKGKVGYERILYDSLTGKISRYSFQRPDCDSCIYVRKYNKNGVAISDSGNLFFLINADKINPRNLEVENNGQQMHIWIYAPDSSHTDISLYVLIKGKKEFVFKKNEAIPYVWETWIDTKKGNKEYSVIDIWMELPTTNGDTLKYNDPFYFKVVDRNYSDQTSK